MSTPPRRPGFGDVYKPPQRSGFGDVYQPYQSSHIRAHSVLITGRWITPHVPSYVDKLEKPFEDGVQSPPPHRP